MDIHNIPITTPIPEYYMHKGKPRKIRRARATGEMVKPIVTKRIAKVHVEASTQAAILELPFEEGFFKFIPCDRKKATAIQRWLYSINKNNAAGRVYATRYNVISVGLLTWRMA